jgi:hypothetical protein
MPKAALLAKDCAAGGISEGAISHNWPSTSPPTKSPTNLGKCLDVNRYLPSPLLTCVLCRAVKPKGSWPNAGIEILSEEAKI